MKREREDVTITVELRPAYHSIMKQLIEDGSAVSIRDAIHQALESWFLDFNIEKPHLNAIYAKVAVVNPKTSEMEIIEEVDLNGIVLKVEFLRDN
jgi:hypothetical protein